MKIYLNYFLKAVLLVVVVGFVSCEKEENGAADEEFALTASISECVWAPYSMGDDSIFDHKINFANNDIYVYDGEGVIADEGNWNLENGKVAFNSLSDVFANYNGLWDVVEDRDGFLELKQGDVIINFEQDCQ